MSPAAQSAPKRILIFRLSSLGDLILSTAALEAERLKTARVDWVVAEEFAGILEGHPRVARIWKFRRKAGLGAWLKLCQELADAREPYDEVIDLHRTLRTRIARWVFRRKHGRALPWRSVAKPRLGLYGFYLLKRLWPRELRPTLAVRRFGLAAGGTGEERPSLAHLAACGPLPMELSSPARFYCVMPASLWDGKKWPVSRFLKLAEELRGRVPVVLGTSSDPESQELAELLRARGLPHVSGVGRWSLAESAAALSRSEFYVGNDTGLAHLAEAVGTRAFVLFGPTVPEMGFGPWRPESRAIGSGLWCRPCGKDGRYCFRPIERYACMKRLDSSSVASSIEQATSAQPSTAHRVAHPADDPAADPASQRESR